MTNPKTTMSSRQKKAPKNRLSQKNEFFSCDLQNPAMAGFLFRCKLGTVFVGAQCHSRESGNPVLA